MSKEKESKTARKSAAVPKAARGPAQWTGFIPTAGGLYFLGDRGASRWYPREYADRVFRGLL